VGSPHGIDNFLDPICECLMGVTTKVMFRKFPRSPGGLGMSLASLEGNQNELGHVQGTYNNPTRDEIDGLFRDTRINWGGSITII